METNVFIKLLLLWSYYIWLYMLSTRYNIDARTPLLIGSNAKFDLWGFLYLWKYNFLWVLLI